MGHFVRDNCWVIMFLLFRFQDTCPVCQCKCRVDEDVDSFSASGWSCMLVPKKNLWAKPTDHTQGQLHLSFPHPFSPFSDHH